MSYLPGSDEMCETSFASPIGDYNSLAGASVQNVSRQREDIK